MAMSKKHYEAFAKALNEVVVKETKSSEDRKLVGACIIAVANVLHSDNPNFDRARFFNACIGR
jgi:hypothetical protein